MTGTNFKLGIAASLLAALTLATTGCGANAGASTAGEPTGSSAQRFPEAIYPKPVPPRHHWGLDQICPSPKGVELRSQHSSHAEHALRQIRGRRQHDRRHSDRAFWPVLRHIHRPILGPKASVSSGAARRSAYGSLAAHNCGRRVVRRSWAIEVGKSAALKATYFVLQRKSHWLVWFEYP